MPWLNLIFETSADEAEALSDALTEAGAQAVIYSDPLNQPLYEPPPGSMPLWHTTRLTGMFPADSDMQQILLNLSQQLGHVPSYHLQPLEEQDWERVWLKFFHPTRFGEQLWIVPSGYEPPAPDAVNLRLDPGMAFGTGSHPTTALCLEWLDQHRTWLASLPDGETVLDYGCGSGVLAIAALLLGAPYAHGLDIDPQALLASQDNARRNGVATRLSLGSDQEPVPAMVPLLMANILAGPLLQLADRFASLVSSGGLLLLSGILQEQAPAVAARYEQDFMHIQTTCREGWCRIEAKRK
jgi:ribosomal protein L11 methyltransferase